MEFKDDGKPKQMTWRVFRPAPKPKPEPSVAPKKIVLFPRESTTLLFPSTRIPSPTKNPRNAPRISIGIIQQEPASTPGSPLQPKRGPIATKHLVPPITGNPNQMESGGQISGGPRRTCLIIAIIVLSILFLLTLAFSIVSLVVFFYNGDPGGNWNILTTFPENEYEAVEEDATDRDY